MDKITKLLKKLSAKERGELEAALELLLSGKQARLDIKKFKGANDIYRVHVAALRIIFQKQGKDIQVLEVSRRDENTYKNY